jgi:hypothetical protein
VSAASAACDIEAAGANLDLVIEVPHAYYTCIDPFTKQPVVADKAMRDRKINRAAF